MSNPSPETDTEPFEAPEVFAWAWPGGAVLLYPPPLPWPQEPPRAAFRDGGLVMDIDTGVIRCKGCGGREPLPGRDGTKAQSIARIDAALDKFEGAHRAC